MGNMVVYSLRAVQLLVSATIIAGTAYTNWWGRFWLEVAPINILYFLICGSSTFILLIPLTLSTYYLRNSLSSTIITNTVVLNLRRRFSSSLGRRVLIFIDGFLVGAWAAAGVEGYLFLRIRQCFGFVCNAGLIAIGLSGFLALLFLVTAILQFRNLRRAEEALKTQQNSWDAFRSSSSDMPSLLPKHSNSMTSRSSPPSTMTMSRKSTMDSVRDPFSDAAAVLTAPVPLSRTTTMMTVRQQEQLELKFQREQEEQQQQQRLELLQLEQQRRYQLQLQQQQQDQYVQQKRDSQLQRRSMMLQQPQQQQRQSVFIPTSSPPSYYSGTGTPANTGLCVSSGDISSFSFFPPQQPPAPTQVTQAVAQAPAQHIQQTQQPAPTFQLPSIPPQPQLQPLSQTTGEQRKSYYQQNRYYNRQSQARRQSQASSAAASSAAASAAYTLMRPGLAAGFRSQESVATTATTIGQAETRGFV